MPSSSSTEVRPEISAVAATELQIPSSPLGWWWNEEFEQLQPPPLLPGDLAAEIQNVHFDSSSDVQFTARIPSPSTGWIENYSENPFIGNATSNCVAQWPESSSSVLESVLAQRWAETNCSVTNPPEISINFGNAAAEEARNEYTGGWVNFQQTEAEGETEMTMGRAKSAEKKGKAKFWDADEHMLFLIGLKTYGKGDWRSIAREVVVTKTAAQVASHAQKFFLHRTSEQSRKRKSVFDITDVDPHTEARLLSQKRHP